MSVSSDDIQLIDDDDLINLDDDDDGLIRLIDDVQAPPRQSTRDEEYVVLESDDMTQMSHGHVSPSLLEKSVLPSTPTADLALSPSELTSLAASSPPIIPSSFYTGCVVAGFTSSSNPSPLLDQDINIIINVGGKIGKVNTRYLRMLNIDPSKLLTVEHNDRTLPFHDEDPVLFSRLIAYFKYNESIGGNVTDPGDLSGPLLDILSKYDLIESKRSGRTILISSNEIKIIVPRCVRLHFEDARPIMTTTINLSQSEYFCRRFRQLDQTNPRASSKPLDIEITNIDYEHFSEFVRLARYGYSHLDSMAFTNILNDLGVRYQVTPVLIYPLVRNHSEPSSATVFQGMKGISSVLSQAATGGAELKPAVSSQKCYALLSKEQGLGAQLNFRLWDEDSLKPTFFTSLELIIDLPWNENDHESLDTRDPSKVVVGITLQEENTGRVILDADSYLLQFLASAAPPFFQKSQMIYEKNLIKLIRFSYCLPLQEPLRLQAPPLLVVKLATDIHETLHPEKILSACILAECQWNLSLILSTQKQVISTNQHLRLPYPAVNWTTQSLTLTKQSNITAHALLAGTSGLIEALLVQPKEAVLELILIEKESGEIARHHDTIQSRNAQYRVFGKEIDAFYFDAKGTSQCDTGIPTISYDIGVITHAWCQEVRVYCKEKVWLVPN